MSPPIIITHKGASYSAEDIANYILWFCNEHGDWITNLKLQKLLYFAHAWYLAIFDKPLFNDRIEAWVHGPVIPNIYHLYKHFKWSPIITDKIESPSFPECVIKHLDEIMTYYGTKTAYELELISHDAEPWKKARGNKEIDELCTEEITDEDMTNYYKKLMENNLER